MDDRQKSTTPPRKKRRVLKTLSLLGLLAIGFVAALPWLLGTPPARAWIVGQVNAKLAPGSIRLSGLGLSWSGPIQLDGVALLDPKGKTVLASDRLTVDRGLLGLITSRPDYGTITIEGATIDLERRVDGTIDLVEAIASVMKPEPVPTVAAPPPVAGPAPTPAPSTLAVKVVLKGGTLKLSIPELVEPITAGSLEGSVTIAPGKPIQVVARLSDEGRSLDIHSTLDPPGDRKVSVDSKNWPIHVRQAGVMVKGRLEGKLEATQEKGQWSVQGDTVLLAVEAHGPALQGDRLQLDRVTAACDIQQSSTGWAIRKLDLTSPVAHLQGNGTIPAIEGTPTRLVGKVDLVALAKMLPNALSLRDNLTLSQGSASIRVDVSSTGGVDRLDLLASLDDFEAIEAARTIRLRHPVYLTGKAARSASKVTVETLEVKASGVDITASGDLETGVKLAGTVDLARLMIQLRDVLDLGALDVSGNARLGADYRHINDSYKGRFAIEVDSLKVIGKTTEPIDRKEARFEGWAIGPARPDGTPNACSRSATVCPPATASRRWGRTPPAWARCSGIRSNAPTPRRKTVQRTPWTCARCRTGTSG